MTDAAAAPGARIGARALAAVAIVVALLLAWRAIVAATTAWQEGGRAVVLGRATSTAGEVSAEQRWRAQLARNPTDFVALLGLARVLGENGDVAGARAAIVEATRLAPADRPVLTEAAAFHLRAGEELEALAILRRVADLHPDARATIWPVFTAVLESGRRDDFFAGIAREDPEWWPSFFGHACQVASSSDGLQRVFAIRAAAGKARADERRCLIGRLQREGRWTNAYQAWLNSLPPAHRQRVGNVYNGDFELPISNLGFDWILHAQDGVVVDVRPAAGADGRGALKVELLNKRWSGAPVHQTLMLFPGKYRFEGRGRAERLETWLGVQWGLYCLAEDGATPRQLARSGRFLGSSDWNAWDEAFVVPKDCPVQRLRLELANPRGDADTPGNVAARLSGTAWFDDFLIRGLD